MSGACMAVRRMFAALLALLACWCGGARADTAVSLFQGFRGQVNFTGTEETLRTKANNQPCKLVNNSAISATLSGIPSGARILSAQLYWAGSGNTPVYTVALNGVAVTAPAARRFTSATVGSGLNYFAGAADVTNQVALKGNGLYSFSGLKVDNGNPWCSVQGVVGGFAIVVVYSHSSEAYRMLNLYEGFQYFRYTGFTLTLNNFAIPNPLPAASTGRVGHITWEGDATLSGGGEDLLFNGYEMTDSLNPSGNQFNSASNVTGDTTSYGIDFDTYSVKYPVIQAGQTTATTTYRTGQDMVLLSAEIAALPYTPGADLALSMTRSGALQVGSSAQYVITVTNAGNDIETGPVTVVDTLPAGLALVSAAGTGWTCTNLVNAGKQTVVTCSGAGPVSYKTSMNPLVLTVSPTAVGNYTNSATVSGKSNDINPNNNGASDTSGATDPNAGKTGGTLVFTSGPCKAGDVIGTDCPRFSGPVTAGAGQIYITNTTLGTQGPVATAVGTRDSTVAAQLSLACTPNKGVLAAYVGLQLGCGAAAQTAQLPFPAGQPTAQLSNATALAAFTYLDVGQLKLTLSYNGSTTSQDFVSRPAGVVLDKVLRSSDLYPDLNNLANPPDVAFAKAGEEFQLYLAATMVGTSRYAPSFGSEATAPAVGLAIANPVGKDAALAITDNFSKPGAGYWIGKAQWYEAGLLTLTPALSDYLNSGAAVQGSARVIGRFYPDHFTTDFAAPFGCLPAMACVQADPDNQVAGVSGAMYSGQPVTATVYAFGLARPGADAAALTLYQNPAGSKRSIVLAPVNAANGNSAPASGAMTLLQPLPTSTTDNPYPTLSTQLRYQLAVPYDPAKPRAGNWSAPLPVYLRARATDTRYVKDAGGNDVAQDFTISSQATASGGAPAPQYDDGLQVVDGRLLVGNVFGSELTQLPLPLTAQYWTGTLWQMNTNDNASVVATSLGFGNCTRSFVGNCRLTALVPATPPTDGGTGLQLANGSGRLTLKAPPRGQNGSIDITAVQDATGTTATPNPEAATWLPSTSGHATFGLFKSPLIYLREVY